jgi:hypothetical protein
MKILSLVLVGTLGACSSGEQTEQVSAKGRDVHLTISQVGSGPTEAMSEFRGTFQGTEPCLYFQDPSRKKVPVAFLNRARWDRSKKGLVFRGADGTEKIYLPGEWIIIKGWEVNSESLAGSWTDQPPPECRSDRTLLIQTLTHNGAAPQRAGAKTASQ